MSAKSREKTTNELLEEISQKLSELLILVAIQGKDIDTQLSILHESGWEWKEIGQHVGLSGDAAKKRYSRKK